MPNIITREKALEIVHEFTNNITAVDPDGIIAVYLIGSLGGGYYRAGQSDIDAVVIAKNDASISQDIVDQYADFYFKKYAIPKGFGAILIHESELYPPYIKSELEEFEFSVEIARLKTQGELFYGNFTLEHVPMPAKEHFIKDAQIMETWLASAFGYPIYANMDVTSCVNTILQVVRRYLMIEKSIFEFNKFKTRTTYASQSPEVIDPCVFAFIDDFLHGKTSGSSNDLKMLRTFGAKLTDYYNQKFLGKIFH